MRTVALTGSASGIGAATRARLEEGGWRVIGVDLRDAEVIADLTGEPGRRAAADGVRKRAAGRLDGLVVCAGLGPHVADLEKIVSLNYFGAERLLELLREALAAGDSPAAVAVSSNSSVLVDAEMPLVATCLSGNETEARRIAATLDGYQVYAGSKLALARWVRHNAPGSAWAGSGIRLNAVAPGAVSTPLLQEGLEHETFGPAIRNFPIPTGGFGRPEQIAAAIDFLLGPDASFCCGSVLFVDGGSDAMLRPDRY